ncbi:MAG: TlpA disulfide reductase family protein [Ilumatobacteraceae bacterium]
MRQRIACIAAAVSLLGACGAGQTGETLPLVEMSGLTNGSVTLLSDIQGPAVVNLWATWCAPCRAEIPDFESVHQARGDEVTFVGINIGESTDRALEFIAEVGATYDQYSDANGEVATALRATSMPTTVVIDAAGVIIRKQLGPLDQDGLNDAIDESLADR